MGGRQRDRRAARRGCRARPARAQTVIAAEFIAAQSGIGYFIFNSRLFAQTDNVFVGIITLGMMGFVANGVLKMLLSRIAYRYDVKL